MSEDVEQYVQKLKVTELREELKKRGLGLGGVKAVLAQRLQEAMEAEGETGNHKEPEEPADEEGDSEVDIDRDANEPAVPQSDEAPVNDTPDQEEEEEEKTEDDEADVKEEDEEGGGGNDGEEEEEAVANDQDDDIKQEESEEESQATNDDELVTVEPQESIKEETKTEEPMEEPTVDEEPPPAEEPVTLQEAKEEEPEVKPLADVPDGVTFVDDSSAQPKEEESMECSGGASTQDGEEAKSEAMAAESGMEGNNEEKPNQDVDMKGSEDRGLKRIREESEGLDGDSKKEETKVDPQTVPDPESVADWSDESIKEICSSLFLLPEDTTASVTLNPRKSDLHFIISSDGLGGAPLTEGGFAYLRASSKATWGVKSGSYYFECKIEEKLPVDIEEEDENGGGEGEIVRKTEPSHNVRVGWSSLDSDTIAGDDKNSFAYDSSGKKVTRSNSEDYGETFDEGDVIGCYVKLTDDSRTILFTKNGVSQTEAFNLLELNSESILFPHVSTRNYRVSFNFGGNPEPYYPPPDETYRPLQEAGEEERECVPNKPLSKNECEVIMMVGLPGCGKTHWASRHASKNFDKAFRIIGPYQLLERMLSKKRRSMTNWNEFVLLTAPMVNTLCLLASNMPGNYIIDQINVYADSQKTKMSYFEGFSRKALVVIPPHHELRKRRVDRIREGCCMEVPQNVIDAFKANFHIPREDDGVFDEINFSEIYGPASDKIVRQYKDDALGLPTPYIPSKRPRYESKGRSYSSPRPKPSPYGYGAYGSSSRYYPPPNRGYYAPPPPPHYRSYYAPPPPPPGAGGWGHMRGRYGHPPPPPPPNPRYGAPRPYYSNRGSGGYYNRY
ncbi:PREDICTED: heterogeneous nuclear ribonucleoprotein U-like [Amphimedon queenslandica]|uniref:SAP domain-containing protein n=1 Tax=Amphimedon queenslandica TaxID=400682 RepID=A0AAN0ID34_AMPQE|nr:PREDICTED: heterogeneous nuclear ribonucleoprotein U-like [Amphimedon queenslandica]|eukprot:XP_003385794.1 PREDICTED: heterogeneous nuclear ribonucleoprotein U-like [Amphimedon queenslandica]